MSEEEYPESVVRVTSEIVEATSSTRYTGGWSYDYWEHNWSSTTEYWVRYEAEDDAKPTPAAGSQQPDT